MHPISKMGCSLTRMLLGYFVTRRGQISKFDFFSKIDCDLIRFFRAYLKIGKQTCMSEFIDYYVVKMLLLLLHKPEQLSVAHIDESQLGFYSEFLGCSSPCHVSRLSRLE